MSASVDKPKANTMLVSQPCLFCVSKKAGVRLPNGFFIVVFNMPVSDLKYCRSNIVGMEKIAFIGFDAIRQDSKLCPGLAQKIHALTEKLAVFVFQVPNFV